MSITVSPYLSQALSQANAPTSSGGAPNAEAPSNAKTDSNPQSPATPADSVTLSPAAQNKLNKTLIESAMERVLEGVKNSTGPKLVFQPAIGAKLDESC